MISQREVDKQHNQRDSDLQMARDHISQYLVCKRRLVVLRHDLEALEAKINKTTQMPRDMVVQSSPLITVADLRAKLCDMRTVYEQEWLAAEVLCNTVESTINAIEDVKGQEMDKELLRLKYIRDASYYEIAEAIDYSKSAVEKYLPRALVKYAKTLRCFPVSSALN